MNHTLSINKIIHWPTRPTTPNDISQYIHTVKFYIASLLLTHDKLDECAISQCDQ